MAAAAVEQKRKEVLRKKYASIKVRREGGREGGREEGREGGKEEGRGRRGEEWKYNR